MKKFINFRPAVVFAISLAFGIVAGSLFYFNKLLLGIVITVIACAVVGFYTLFSDCKGRARTIFLIAFSIVFILGATFFSVNVNAYESADLNGYYLTVRGSVEEKKQTDTGDKIIVGSASVSGARKGLLKYKIVLYVYGECSADMGDVVEFKAVLKDKSAIYEQSFSVYDVASGYKYTAELNAEDVTVIKSAPNLFQTIHLFIRDNLKKGLGVEEFSIAYGMLLGNTEYIDYDTIATYRESGVAHIFAVSGLHIGFLALALNFLFDRFKANRVVKAVAITLVLVCYSGVCGFSTSSLRATIMASVSLFSAIKGYRYDGLSSVGISAFIVLLLFPLQLFCVGFQLSFAVVLGIILLSPVLKKLLKFLPVKLAKALATVLSAQLAGIPICLHAFGQFSIVAIIVNLLLIPVVTVIFITTFGCVILGGIIGIPKIALALPGFALKVVNFAITIFDYSFLIIGGFTLGIFAVFYFAWLIISSGIINVKKLTAVITSAICLVVSVAGALLYGYQDVNTARVHVIGSERVCVTVVDGVKSSTMIVSNAWQIWSTSRFNRLKERQGVMKIDTVVFTDGGVNDAYQFLSRMHTVFDFDKVCFYGDKSNVSTSVIEKSFGVVVALYGNGEKMDENGVEYVLDGKAVKCGVKGQSFLVFSKYGNGVANYSKLQDEYDYVIASDCVEQIFGHYSSANKISYKDYGKEISAQTSGTYTIEL